MMKIANILSAAGIIILLIAQGGCEETSQSGRLVLKLADDPIPLEWIAGADITITGIEARIKYGDEDARYVMVTDDTIVSNLVELRNGVTGLLADIEFGPGNVDQFRIYMGDASITLANGRAYNLKFPSGAESGLKVYVDPPVLVENGFVAELVLDFDLSKSLVVLGGAATMEAINGFIFKPVVRVINTAITGAAAGKVYDQDVVPVQNASVWISADTIVGSAMSDSRGYYSIIGIPSGIFKIYCTKQGYDTISSEIVIIEQNRTTRNFTLTAVN